MNDSIEKYCDMKYYNRLCEMRPEVTLAKNEMGMSQIYASLYHDALSYATETKKYRNWDGIKWSVDVGNVEASLCARAQIDLMLLYASRIEYDDIKEKFIDFVAKHTSLHKRESIIRDAQPLLAMDQKDFDSKPNLYNCLNGTLDLNTMQMHEHRPSDFLSKVSGCEFDESADPAKWNNFINEIMMGNMEKIEYLKRGIGASLSPVIKQKIITFLLGEKTNNGKTCFIEPVRKMHGDYGATVEPQTIAQARNNAGGVARPDIARLQGIRFVSISEPPKGMLLDGSMIKKLTGGDTITARKLYEDEVEFSPQFKIFMHCNHLPVVTDETLFTSDRIRIITFDRHFAEHEQNKNLIYELQEPEVLSSVLNWAIEGLIDFRENGENPPQCVRIATAMYEKKSDKIKRFFDDSMEESEQNSSGAEVYDAYRKWCTENGYTAEGKGIFFAELRRRSLLKSGTVAGKTDRNAVVGYSVIE